MSNTPDDLRYAESHEWVRFDGEDKATIGISYHAQSELGDLVFVELPEVNSELQLGEEAGVVESVKTASDIYSPVSGKVLAVNEALGDTPEAINNDPYGDGWIYKIELSDTSELDQLMSAADYSESISDDEEE